MHGTPDHHDHSRPDDASPELRAALTRAYSPRSTPNTVDLDGAIRAASHARLSRRRVQPRLILAGGALAAAAGLALTFIIISTRPRPTPAPSIAPAQARGTATTPGDLNADGTLNILDALALSNHLRHAHTASAHTAAPDPSTDFNADGATTRADVDALALRIVSLGGAG